MMLASERRAQRPSVGKVLPSPIFYSRQMKLSYYVSVLHVSPDLPVLKGYKICLPSFF